MLRCAFTAAKLLKTCVWIYMCIWRPCLYIKLCARKKETLFLHASPGANNTTFFLWNWLLCFCIPAWNTFCCCCFYFYIPGLARTLFHFTLHFAFFFSLTYITSWCTPFWKIENFSDWKCEPKKFNLKLFYFVHE